MAPRLPWLRLWLAVLNGTLFVAGVVLGTWVNRTAFLLALVVPIGLLPFSYARLRLERMVRRTLGLGPRRRNLYAALSGCALAFDGLMIAQLVTAQLAHQLPTIHGPGISWLGPVWFSAHALLFLGYLAVDATRVARRVASRIWTALAPDEAAGAPRGLAASPERRMFLRRAGVAGAGLPFFVSLSSVNLSYDFRVQEREIELPRWPRALDGLRVAHLSDIHVGGGMNRDRLLHVAELTNRARPDVVLHTGDFLTHRSGAFDAPLYEALARIEAPHGQWACLGNHDFDDVERLVGRLTASGVTVLRNRAETIAIEGQPVEIAGADFVFTRVGRAGIYQRVVTRLGPRSDAPRIFLNHDPMAFADLPDGCADLVLSGHTHGGHVGLQVTPTLAVTVVGLAGLPDQGVFSRGDMRLFVTRCVGFYGYPMRVGIPPEISLLVLRSPRAVTTPA
ncbi:MAG TPA: metallophosphoesterase [Candidatus Binatia bacterium]|nr:metallophosphoesterase [Candidatus Binatia bacterium]